jgi:hypothetical protein
VIVAAVRVSREWLQKHPTPLGDDGDFRWYPGAVAADVRADLAAGLVREDDEAVWLAPGRVVWARRFVAVAPADGRRYAGIAAVVVEGGEESAALLARCEVPEARPWCVDPSPSPFPSPPPCPSPSPPPSPFPSPPPSPFPSPPPSPSPSPSQLAHAAAALWRGGALPRAAAHPRILAVVEAWLPRAVRDTPRCVRIDDAAPTPITPVARWLARAIAAEGVAAARGRAAWRAVQSLAAAEATPVDELVAELVALDRADDADAVARDVHRWGRGDAAPPAALARALARRAVAEQLLRFDRGAAARWRRDLRRTALLPAPRAAALERAVTRHLPALAEVDEVTEVPEVAEVPEVDDGGA